MPPKHHFEDHPIVHRNGKVSDIFAHRFILETADGKCLADLTPHGADAVKLKSGDEIVIEGEQKPSEVKVLKLERSGQIFVIAHKPPKHEKPNHHKPGHHRPDHHREADASIAKTAVKNAGYEVIGEPRRKPKHFEILGKKEKSYQELHVEFDGSIYKEKPIPAHDHKWQTEIAANLI
jgi:hypothetical protein